MEQVLFSLPLERLEPIFKNWVKSAMQEIDSEPAPGNKNRFYLSEAAKYTGLPVPTFRLHQNRIGGTKIGKRWIFSKNELDKFIEQNRRKTLAEIREAI